MPSKSLTTYWDACVFLSYINGIPDRMPMIDALLSEAERGEILIVTSMISVVEVAFGYAEQEKKAFSPEMEEKIKRLWDGSSPIRLVEFYRHIAEDAQGLIRIAMQRGWSLKAADAIHLATARRMEVGSLHTYDDKLPRYADDVGLSITAPATTKPQLL